MNEYLTALRKRWLVIVLLAVVGAGIGYYQAQTATPLYRASSEMYVSLARGDTTGELVQGSTYTRSLVESFVQLATTPKVLDPVVDDLGLTISSHALAGAVSATSPLNTVIIQVTAVSKNPDRAAAIANSVAAHLSETVVDLSPTSESGAATVKMNVVAPATAPTAPFSPNKKMKVATGLVGGLAIGVVIALLVARLDTRVRTVKDLPTEPERALLGTIPQDKAIRKHGARAIMVFPHAPLAESYRRVRTNLQFLNVSKPVTVVVISSAVPNEGKSLTSINLALTMAEQGKRVLLVDADLRRSSIAMECGLEGSAGLSTVLVGEATMDEVVQPWGAPNLDVITAGATPPNPGHLVESEAMTRFIAAARAEYDFVVVDAPPMLAVTDAAVLGRQTDGVIVVAGSSKVRRHELRDALASLDAIEVTCLGIVLNKVRTGRGDSYSYSYTYSTRNKRSRRRRRRGTTTEPRTQAAARLAAIAAGELPTPATPVPEVKAVDVPEPMPPADRPVETERVGSHAAVDVPEKAQEPDALVEPATTEPVDQHESTELDEPLAEREHVDELELAEDDELSRDEASART